jgi:hypothetical protein
VRKKYYKQKQIATADCTQSVEKVEHTQPCQVLAKEQYIKRHGRVCAQLHFNTCKEIGVELDKLWYDHVPKSAETSREGKVTIL